MIISCPIDTIGLGYIMSSSSVILRVYEQFLSTSFILVGYVKCAWYMILTEFMMFWTN